MDNIGDKMKSILMSAILITALLLVACASIYPTPGNTPAFASATLTPQATSIPTPTVIPTSTIANPNPFNLPTAQLSRLGKPAEPFVAKRQVVLQRFEHGVMLIFAGTGNVFDSRGGGSIFALANDGRAWRIRDTFVETSKNPDDWYTCERKPGLRPERSGIPWRGFGKAWCENPSVRDALGFAKIYEDVDDAASFQSYEQGFALQLSDWKSYPGWKNGQVYVIFYSSVTSPDFVLGKWE